jgi:D-glycero-alpha-D-manno-heptose-7-phosphate kinase
MTESKRPDFIIHSKAPIRICDIGGWTDTWFAEYGRVFNIAVSPFAEVQVTARSVPAKTGQIIISAEDFGESYTYDPTQNNSQQGWNRHPLLEASIEYMHPPDYLSLEITIHSQAPAAASTGTSAAVTVALLGGLDALTPGRLSPHEIAMAAQKVETELLGQQCGIQDQLCCAHGGINYYEMDQYPHASVVQLDLPDPIWWELERRLALVYLGKSHSSSHVHEMVIEAMEGLGPDNRYLEALRATAPRARDALDAGDFGALGQAMIDNNQAQRQLHPALISTEADQVIEISRAHGAIGWKVNGAGGDGGSVTLLCGERSDIKRTLIREIKIDYPEFKHIPINLSRDGLRVWQSYP